MTFCLAVLIFVLQCLGSLSLSSGSVVHDDAYFGVNRKLKCNCESRGCFENGTCKSNNTDCLWGWFGPLCQFRDAALDSNSSFPKAVDNNALTCGSNKHRPIIIRLSEKLVFSWMRIEFDDSLGKPENISLNISSDGNPVDCHDKKDLYMASNVIDIFCLVKESIDTVHITWTGVLAICTININEGRNMALNMNNTRSSSGNAMSESDSAHLVVDGKYGNSSACAKTSSIQDFQFWDFQFHVGHFVHTIVIRRNSENLNFSHMHGFRFDVYSETDILALHSDYMRSDDHSITIKTETIEPVMHMRIILGNRNPNQVKYIELCEIEAFGDCAPPYYGLYCEGVCGKRCKDRRCHYNGFCYHCLDKKLGKRCLDDIVEKGLILSQGEITIIIVISVFMSCALCCLTACLGRIRAKYCPKKDIPLQSLLCSRTPRTESCGQCANSQIIESGNSLKFPATRKSQPAPKDMKDKTKKADVPLTEKK